MSLAWCSVPVRRDQLVWLHSSVMRSSLKTEDQLDLQALHRVRERLVQRRTALINQIRGFLLERGISFAKGQPSHLRKNMANLVEDADANLTRRMRTLLDRLWGEWKQLDYDIEIASQDIERIGGEDEGCQRLRQIPGVAPPDFDRNPGCDRQRSRLPQGTRVRSLARACAATTLDWARQLEARAPRDKVIVAVANKLARVAWAVLFNGLPYHCEGVCVRP
jgi:transposase